MATKVCCWLVFTASFVGLSMATPRDDGGKAPRLALNDGNSIPIFGLGTFLGFDDKGQLDPRPMEVSNAVEWAIESGYRLIDTAAVYKDEAQIGEAIEKALRGGAIKREDLFIVTKLPSTRHSQDMVRPALEKSLKDLKLDYVDLYLIHSPMAFTADGKFDLTDYLETWKAMEAVKNLGLAKSIGLSNFNESQIRRILDNCDIKPAVLQVEINLNLRAGPLVKFCTDKGIVVMAYSPFGSLFGARPGQNPPPPRQNDPQLLELANKYKKSSPQIVLRYLVQRGVVVIPKSVHKERIQQNIDIFDFALTQDEIKTLDGFNTNFRVVSTSFWQDHPYYPYERTDAPAKKPF